ncbi:MAG: OmpA family protein [Sulfurimonas sp.]|jgi:OOP family OmpA-OmpF porin|nr:OmpA family protein [Sulfurimonas sp.]MBU1217748.1 OmpA family protein [bacterium]MBU1434224.1 OmpA family protein [bacterium]MBU1504319.1 OmpA family protein [bacterium]MBU3939433.1 OmpA family protein [bacterium]
MKKILLIPALLAGSLALATPYNYEITPVVGYNFAEGNLGFKDNGYMVYGVELQYNNPDWAISPELAVLYTDSNSKNGEYELPADGSTDVLRIALNGVYTYKTDSYFQPFAKAGLGMEKMDNKQQENVDSLFLDAGVGVKMPIMEHVALKLEAVYELKENAARWDNNVMGLFGVNFAFGAPEVKPAPVAAPVVAPVVAKPAPVVVAPVKVDGDADKDGVKDSMDKCPNTPAGVQVDKDGCTIVANLHINFDNNSYKIDKASDANVQKFADFLKAAKSYKAEIIGHTDSVGSEAANMKLSQNRANAVKTSLVAKGVSADRVTTVGQGESQPVASNMTKEGRAENRRIEAVLSK